MKENDIEGSIGSAYGLPVFVQNINGKAKMVLMRKGAYAVSIDNSFHVSENDGSQDSEVARAGAVVIYGEVMASGMVANPLGIRILKGTK